MKNFKFLILVTVLFAFQCENDDPAPMDNLEVTGLFGKWEIQSEIINGNISDLLPKCCEFLEFSPDSISSDNKGLLTYTNGQDENPGVFEVNLTNQTVLFTDDDSDVLLFEFEVTNTTDTLSITFTEDNTTYTQTWVRVE